MKKISDIITDGDLCDLVEQVQEAGVEAPKSKNKALKIFAVLGVIAAVAGIAFAIYRYFKPDYLEDYEDEFEDDDFADDEE